MITLKYPLQKLYILASNYKIAEYTMRELNLDRHMVTLTANIDCLRGISNVDIIVNTFNLSSRTIDMLNIIKMYNVELHYITT